jgi:hypothetical protein
MKIKSALLGAAFAGSMLVGGARADVIDYNLLSISGSWAWGDTQWNNVSGAGYVNNGADVGTVNSIFHSPYVYQSPGSSTSNAIYNWPAGTASLTFAVVGGSATLDSLSILSSRSYSSATAISLLSSNDGGATWTTDLTSTTGALGWNDVGTAGTLTETILLPFGGVQGNEFQFVVSGDQINIHTLTLNGSASAVPEASTWVMMLAGFAGLGFLGYRRSKAATLAA